MVMITHATSSGGTGSSEAAASTCSSASSGPEWQSETSLVLSAMPASRRVLADSAALFLPEQRPDVLNRSSHSHWHVIDSYLSVLRAGRGPRFGRHDDARARAGSRAGVARALGVGEH